MEYRFTGLQVQAKKTHSLENSFLTIRLILDQWNQNFVTRRQLRDLDDSQLRDIGIDRITAQRESQKRFWKN